MKNLVCLAAVLVACAILADALPTDTLSRARRSPARTHQRRVNRRQDVAEESPCRACLEQEVPEEQKEFVPEPTPAEIQPEEPEPEPKAVAPKKEESDEEEDEDDFPFSRNAGKRGSVNTFFPIMFGSYAGRSEGGVPAGIIAVANSFSTGRKSAATSQAKAYGSAAPKN